MSKFYIISADNKIICTVDGQNELVDIDKTENEDISLFNEKNILDIKTKLSKDFNKPLFIKIISFNTNYETIN